MLGTFKGALGIQTASLRECATLHSAQHRWIFCHRRAEVQTAARSSKRGYGGLFDPWREEDRRQALLKYVQEVQPQSVTQFAEETHPMVVQAMRQTALNVVGSLPPQYFNVRITTMAESLAQLMLSIMTTGYMLRSAQVRMELQKSLKELPTNSTSTFLSAPSAAGYIATSVLTTPMVHGPVGPDVYVGGGDVMALDATGFLSDGESSPYAPGVQKKNLEGEILRWHLGRGEVERLTAADYIELLEREVATLRARDSQQPLPALPVDPRLNPPTASSTPLATAGAVDVLGPETDTDTDTDVTVLGSSAYPGQSLACVSSLPGFGERTGAGLPYGSSSGSGALAPGGNSSAAAPATMGCGGIPLVVGSPLGLPRNELLDYLHGLQASGSGGFKELACSPSTASGQDVKEAMELFVARLMGTLDPASLSKEAAEFSSVELSKVLFWLMAVGYTLKSIEAQLDVDDGMGGVSGSNIGGGPSGLGGSGGRAPSSGNSSDGRKRPSSGFFSGLQGLLPGF